MSKKNQPASDGGTVPPAVNVDVVEPTVQPAVEQLSGTIRGNAEKYVPPPANKPMFPKWGDVTVITGRN